MVSAPPEATLTASFTFNMDEAKTKSVQRAIAPLIHEVTLLADPGTWMGKRRSAKTGQVLIGQVEKSISDFLQQAEGAVRDCPLAAGPAMEELRRAIDDVRGTGNEMMVAGRDFIVDTSSSTRRIHMVSAARALLTAVARLLIISDMIDVQMILRHLIRTKNELDALRGATSNQELQERFSSVRGQLEELTECTRRRLNDLRNPAEQDDLKAARAMLKSNTPIIYTSTKAFVRHPEVDAGRLNRDFAHAEMVRALAAMGDVLEGRQPSPDVGISHYGRVGDLIAELDQFQNRVYMEPNTYRAKTHRPELEELLERIVSGAAHIADEEHTREERKKRIVDECNALRQALQDLLSEYERNIGRSEPSEATDLAMVSVNHCVRELRRHLRRAVVDHVSDAFLDTRVPLLVLIDAARRQDQQATIEAGDIFIEHADKIVQVANLVCRMSNNEDGVRVIKYAANLVQRLAPQVVNAAYLLCSRGDSKVAQENMNAFKEAWEEKVRLLTMAVDAVVTVDDFLAVSEAHIVEDVKSCIQAVYSKDGETLDRTAGAIRGRSLRVCDVVDAEMDQMPANAYSDAVRKATRMLRNDVLEGFSARAERVVAGLCNGEDRDTDGDVDELIDASGLVHEAIKDIRHALLMNRNPEDVDSDNEYEDDGITEVRTNTDTRSVVSESENQQKVMRNLPEPEKRKIQEQIDVFKIAQTKFEREVGKWDETGNDIIGLAKHMCMVMMNMTDFTRGRGPLKTTMDVIRAAQEISDLGAKLNALANQIGEESVESETKKDLYAYLQRIILYCQQLNITSRVKADVQQVGDELIVSGLESAMSLIQTARNLLNAVVLTVKAAYIASTKYRRKNTATPNLVEWRMAPPQKQPLVRPAQPAKTHGVVRRASDRRAMPPIKALAEFTVFK